MPHLPKLGRIEDNWCIKMYIESLYTLHSNNGRERLVKRKFNFGILEFCLLIHF